MDNVPGSTSGASFQALMATTSADVRASVESTTSRTGPSEQSTAGIRVSRNTGSRIPRTVGAAGSSPSSTPVTWTASDRPPIDSNVGTAK